MCNVQYATSLFFLHHFLPSFIARVASFTIGLKANKRQSYIYENCFDCREQTNPMYDPNAVVISCGSILLSSSAASRLDVEMNIYEIYLAHHHLISCN